MNRRVVWATAALTVWVLARPAGAGPLPESFTLGRYVPDSCWMLMHSVSNPERAYINQQWARVYRAVGWSGIKDEVRSLIMDLLHEEDRPAFDKQWNRAMELLSEVAWSDLYGREFVYAQQVPPLPTYLFLARGNAGTAEKNLPALAAILEHIASLSDSLCLFQETIEGVQVWSIPVPGAPLSIELFGRGDVIGLCTSRSVTSKVVSLMAGHKVPGAIIDLPKFKRALATLPQAEDGVFFFNIESFIADLGAMSDALLAQASDDPDAVAFKQILSKVLGRADVFDYSLTVKRTEGLRESSYTVTALQADKKDEPLAKVFTNQQPLENPHRLIPAEATSFSMSTTIDWGALYDLVLQVLAEDVPGGPEMIEQWTNMQQSVGLDLRGDVLDWFGGEMVSFSLPPTAQDLFGWSGVLMLGVKDAQLATRKVNAGIDRLAELLQEHAHQTLVIQEAPGVAAPGFRVVTHPGLAMLLRPVIGVHDRWLIIGSSPEAVNTCVETAAGKAPCILENKRFQREGLPATSAVYATSFRDMSHFGQELGMVSSLTGLAVGGMIQAASIEDPKSPAIRPLKRLISILGRLTPALAEINFYSSSAVTATFDGLTWRVESVLTYKPPPSPGK